MIEKLYIRVQEKKKNNEKWQLYYKVYKLIINIFYPISQRFRTKTGINASSNIIVSLTTYPARIKNVWVTVATLLNQTYKPKGIILYLSKEQFPKGEEGLPNNLKRLKKRGLSIEFVDGDIKPHKKYYYSFKDYSEYIVITADDDVFYPENHIQQLVEASKEYPDAVICMRSHLIDTFEINGAKEFSPYNKWKNNITDIPDMQTLPVGGNGVLYKPTLFNDELYDIEKITKYCLYTDDLWLKLMEVYSGIKAYNCSKNPLVYFDNIFTQKTGLWHDNTSQGTNRNDVAWRELMEAYPNQRDVLLNK